MKKNLLYKTIIGSPVSMAANAIAVREALKDFKAKLQDQKNILVSSSYLNDSATTIFPYQSVENLDVENYVPYSMAKIYEGIQENIEDCLATQQKLESQADKNTHLQSVVTLVLNKAELLPNKAALDQVRRGIKNLQDSGTIVNIVEFGATATGLGAQLGIQPEYVMSIPKSTDENLKSAFATIADSILEYNSNNDTDAFKFTQE